VVARLALAVLCWFCPPSSASPPDVLLLLGMLMLGMALGALLAHIRHKAQTARIVQEVEAKFGFKSEIEKHDSTKPNAAASQNKPHRSSCGFSLPAGF